MKWKIKFSEARFKELQHQLFSVEPEENGCFLLVQAVGKTLYVTDIIWPQKEEWLFKGEHLCNPSPAYISYSAMVAESKNCSLVFVHTHPNTLHPSTFSYADDIANKKLFSSLCEIIDGPLGSFVISHKGIHGIIFHKRVYEQIESYTIIGKGINKFPDVKQKERALKKGLYDRQLRFMDSGKLSLFQELKIIVVGAGGIGSPIIYQLAKMGIRNLIVYDPDVLDLSNVPRVYGATSSDVGKHKVSVIKAFIEDSTDCKVKAVRKKVSVDTDILSADVIIGGVDNHTTRDTLNSVATKYSIPYIDAACSIPLTPEGGVSQSLVEINTVMPTGPCLWCTGTLNAMKIREEAYSPEEKKKLKEDGYYAGIEKQPSVISLTSAAASLAVNRLMNIIGVYDNEYPYKLIFELNNTILHEPTVCIEPKCRCRKSVLFK